MAKVLARCSANQFLKYSFGKLALKFVEGTTQTPCTDAMFARYVIAKDFVCKQWRGFEFDSGWQQSVEHSFEAIERGKKF